MMRKTVVTLTLVVLLAGTVHGLYDPNNTYTNESDDGDISITGTDSGATAESAGGSGAASEADGTEWRAQFTTVDRTQNTTDDTLENVSFHDTGNGTQTAQFTGHIQMPTPCHTIGHQVEKTDDGFTLTITRHQPDEDRVCTQVVTAVTYDAWFEADAPYTLTVKHGDTTVDTLQSPEPVEDPQSPAQPQQQGFFAGLWNWLTGLF